jgi:hypothetical protein
LKNMRFYLKAPIEDGLRPCVCRPSFLILPCIHPSFAIALYIITFSDAIYNCPR